MPIKKKTLLIAMDMSLTDVRIAMALQKLDENNFIIINNEAKAAEYAPKIELPTKVIPLGYMAPQHA